MLRARKFLEMHPLRRKRRTPRFGRRAHMVAPKRSQRNWHAFIDNHTDSLFAMVFFTITSRHGAGKISSRAKSHEGPHGLRKISMMNLSSGTWRVEEIGAVPRITCRRCG